MSNTYPNGLGQVCATPDDRSAIVTDAVAVISSGWITYAIRELRAGRMPRTKAYLLPSLSGGPTLDLGRGPVKRPQCFGGAAWGSTPDACDFTFATLRPPEVVVVDRFEEMGWPAIRAKGGAA